MKRWAWRLAAALFGLWVVAALYSLRPVSHDPEPVSYLLSWEWGDAQPNEDGTWGVTSDLGYEIVVLDGYLVTYEATVLDCPEESSWIGSIVDAFVPAAAWAGHSESVVETVVAEIVESLGDPQTALMGLGETTTGRYCESHVAYGTVDPTETTLQLRLLIDGDRVVEIATDLAWGTIGELIGEFGDGDLEVEIVRDLGSMFDGIDFETAADDEIAVGLLRALSAGTVFVVP
jgi:hypothetical protein